MVPEVDSIWDVKTWQGTDAIDRIKGSIMRGIEGEFLRERGLHLLAENKEVNVRVRQIEPFHPKAIWEEWTQVPDLVTLEMLDKEVPLEEIQCILRDIQEDSKHT